MTRREFKDLVNEQFELIPNQYNWCGHDGSVTGRSWWEALRPGHFRIWYDDSENRKWRVFNLANGIDGKGDSLEDCIKAVGL